MQHLFYRALRIFSLSCAHTHTQTVEHTNIIFQKTLQTDKAVSNNNNNDNYNGECYTAIESLILLLNRAARREKKKPKQKKNCKCLSVCGYHGETITVQIVN